MRKPAFCIYENKDADQLRGNREADQHLCFRYTDSTIPLLPKSEISCLWSSSLAVQTGFLITRLICKQHRHRSACLSKQSNQLFYDFIFCLVFAEQAGFRCLIFILIQFSTAFHVVKIWFTVLVAGVHVYCLIRSGLQVCSSHPQIGW